MEGARPAFRNVDRLILSVLYRVAPNVPDALTVVMRGGDPLASRFFRR